MLSETLTEGLTQYRIGPKIRALRAKKSLGQGQLAEHSGLSPALLSKLERGQLFPTLPTLLRIAMVFGVGLEHFFSENADQARIAVTRRKDRLRLPNATQPAQPAYFFESLDFPATEKRTDAYYAEFPPRAAPSEEHRHAGTELIYLLSGQLIVSIDGREVVLASGDAMHFDSGVPHRYCGRGKKQATAIVVVTP